MAHRFRTAPAVNFHDKGWRAFIRHPARMQQACPGTVKALDVLDTLLPIPNRPALSSPTTGAEVVDQWLEQSVTVGLLTKSEANLTRRLIKDHC